MKIVESCRYSIAYDQVGGYLWMINWLDGWERTRPNVYGCDRGQDSQDSFDLQNIAYCFIHTPRFLG